MTRENQEAGPFISQHEAENELILYIRHANQVGEITTNSRRIN